VGKELNMKWVPGEKYPCTVIHEVCVCLCGKSCYVVSRAVLQFFEIEDSNILVVCIMYKVKVKQSRNRPVWPRGLQQV
jgi:hypothetical protein